MMDNSGYFDPIVVSSDEEKLTLEQPLPTFSELQEIKNKRKLGDMRETDVDSNDTDSDSDNDTLSQWFEPPNKKLKRLPLQQKNIQEITADPTKQKIMADESKLRQRYSLDRKHLKTLQDQKQELLERVQELKKSNQKLLAKKSELLQQVLYMTFFETNIFL
ncbi:Protein kinase domain containing protein [Reticulomyxa filosa]|uniref:Protein kinase domain containing protein n=1 Tax=Reticulomyxa filosa TaxID=46433 RepID=X6MKE6_RETFI|nr:Protein kinase domain containing protein [Reticulomyxa filosa]|eukprot:ETO13902.1 Protein kinase domain containing protein [Reticulomyxa filosa]